MATKYTINKIFDYRKSSLVFFNKKGEIKKHN